MTGVAAPAAHLLFVEDDDATRAPIAANLAAHGYRVVEAATAGEATRAWDAT